MHTRTLLNTGVPYGSCQEVHKRVFELISELSAHTGNP